MNFKKIIMSAIIAFTALLNYQVNAQDTLVAVNKNKMEMDTMSIVKDTMPIGKENILMATDNMPMEKDKMTMEIEKMQQHSMMMPDLKSWTEASLMAVKEITDKYGKADVVGD